MELSELLQWWNLIFVLPFIGAVIYILLIGTAAPDHGVDAHADASVGLDHGVDHALDAGHDLSHPDASVSVGRALEFFGVGRVPLSIVLPMFWIIWSFVGFVSNTLLARLIAAQPAYVLVSIVMATVIAATITGQVARMFARFMPRTQTYGVDREDLVGSVGVAGYPGVSQRFGEARVYDVHNNQHIVACRIRLDGDPVKTGEKILLIDYDRNNRVFLVEAYDDSA